LLEPRSIAIVGASGDPLKIGGRPLEYLSRYGFQGRVVPVNPNRDRVQGLQCFRRLQDTEPVDLAIVAAPLEGARDAIEQCMAARTRAIVLFTAGFAEVGESGRALQAELAQMASAAGIALLGPNCLGTINVPRNVVATFTTALETLKLTAGSFSYAGQSGALGAYWLEKAVSAGLGIAKWITTGNEAQVTLAEALGYLAEDSESRVIGLYIEDVKRPDEFAAAAAAARRAGKTILAIKGGRSPSGRRAVAGHTGALAGDDAEYQSLLDACGILRVSSLTELVDVARLRLSPRVPERVNRLGVITVSGGAGVLICDAAQDAGLTVPDLPGEVAESIDAVLPSFVRRQNPVDVTGAVVTDTGMLQEVVRSLAQSEAFDAIVMFFGLMSSIKDGIVSAVQSAARYGKPLVVIWMGADPESVRRIEDAGVPVFDEIPPAIHAIAGAASAGALLSR
jgi:acyl-CoA synthetase (NDP forming)